jgi:hypothetical protein
VVVTVTTSRNHIEDAQDTLSGWEALSNFIFGYITEESKAIRVIGLFEVLEGPPERGQRKVVTWSSGT